MAIRDTPHQVAWHEGEPDPRGDIVCDSSGNVPSGQLGVHETALYGWVLEQRSADVERAAEHLGLPVGAVSAALANLTSMRLVIPDGTTPSGARAVDPDAAKAALARPLWDSIRYQQDQLERLEQGFGVLRDRFLRRCDHEALSAVETIPSMEEVRAALNRASAECQKEMLSSQPGGTRVPEAMQEALSRDIAMLDRGVRIRTLYHHTARFNGPSQAYVAAVGARGAEYRTAHELFGRIIVFDREVAFIPDHRGTWGAVVIREPSIVAYLCEVFEQTWTHATPFADAGQDGLEQVAKDLDQTILRLLGSGLKDESIARRLGISLRTTRRHIADILETLGAESRFQAGVLAANAGLMNADCAPGGEDEQAAGL